MIDILPIALLLLLIINSRANKPINMINEEYLSIKTSKIYRGFFALVIVLHHLSQKTTSGTIFPLFLDAGYLAVSFFFFLSGYGLQKSFILKSTKYRKTFLLNRIPGILFPYIIFMIIYWTVKSIMGTVYSVTDVFSSFVNGHPIVSNSWYIIVILVFYLFYWLFMVICNNHRLIILYSSIWYCLWIVVCYFMHYSIWWYRTVHLLIFGIIWATYEKEICKFANKSYAFITPIVWLCFVFLFVFQEKILLMFPHQFLSEFVLQFVLALLFVCSVLLCFLKVKIHNRIFEFIGNISLELYLIHGLLINILCIQNEIIWCITVLSLSIVIAFLLHTIISNVLKKFKAVVQRTN